MICTGSPILSSIFFTTRLSTLSIKTMIAITTTLTNAMVIAIWNPWLVLYFPASYCVNLIPSKAAKAPSSTRATPTTNPSLINCMCKYLWIVNCFTTFSLRLFNSRCTEFVSTLTIFVLLSFDPNFNALILSYFSRGYNMFLYTQFFYTPTQWTEFSTNSLQNVHIF